MAQLVERVLGKDEVTGSIPVSSSKTGSGYFYSSIFFLSVSERLTGDVTVEDGVFLYVKIIFFIRRVTVTRFAENL